MPKKKINLLIRAQSYDAYCATLEVTNLLSQNDSRELEFNLGKVVAEILQKNLSAAQDSFKQTIDTYCRSKTALLANTNQSDRSLEIVISYLEEDIQTLLHALTTDCAPDIRILFNELIPLVQITEKIERLASEKASLSLEVRDKIKHQLATLYSVFATCQFLMTHYALSRAFHELTFKMIVSSSPSFQRALPSQSLAKLSINMLIFIELAEGHTSWAFKQLETIFKSKNYLNESEAFYRNSLAASARYAEIDDYANAHRWLTRALPFHSRQNYEFWTKHYYLRHLNNPILKIGENVLEKLRAWYLVLHMQSVEGLLHYQKRGYSLEITPDNQILILQTTIKRWTPISQKKLLHDLKLTAEFAYSKIVISPVIDADISALTELVTRLKSLEQAHEKQLLREREKRELRKIQSAFGAMTLSAESISELAAKTFLPSYVGAQSQLPKLQLAENDESFKLPNTRCRQP